MEGAVNFKERSHGVFSLRKICAWCPQIEKEGVSQVTHGIYAESQGKEVVNT